MFLKEILLSYYILNFFISLYKFISIKKLRRNYIEKYPFVSILIPARNEEKNLPRLLNSLKNLNYEKFEILIYDDLSEDKTYEIAKKFEDDKIKVIKGIEKPEDWIGKNFALYNLVKVSKGNVLIFLDADVEIINKDFILKVVENIKNDNVITGFGNFEGSGKVILSIITFLFSQIPINYGLNGQFWAIKREIYLKYEPHIKFKNEVLEDVKIGIYLLFKGLKIRFFDLKDVFKVKMYNNTSEVIEGFTKNSYRMFGKKLTPMIVLLYYFTFLLPFILFPIYPFNLICTILILNKLICDIKYGFSIKYTILAPIGFLLFGIIMLRSWYFSITGNLYWKGRKLLL
ncbi:MAG: glycosyltransferase [candidate division WOR-3 bacterium]